MLKTYIQRQLSNSRVAVVDVISGRRTRSGTPSGSLLGVSAPLETVVDGESRRF